MTTPNRVVHFEIHASNPEKIIEYYKNLFGWEIKKWELPGGANYWVVMTGPTDQPGGINGGIVQRMGAAPVGGEPVTAFVCTMEVENLDAMVEKAVATGGQLALPKMPIPGMGWLAYCKDNDGNIFGLMQTDPSAK